MAISEMNFQIIKRDIFFINCAEWDTSVGRPLYSSQVEYQNIQIIIDNIDNILLLAFAGYCLISL